MTDLELLQKNLKSSFSAADVVLSLSMKFSFASRYHFGGRQNYLLLVSEGQSVDKM